MRRNRRERRPVVYRNETWANSHYDITGGTKGDICKPTRKRHNFLNYVYNAYLRKWTVEYKYIYIDSTPWKAIIGIALRAIKSIPMIALQ